MGWYRVSLEGPTLSGVQTVHAPNPHKAIALLMADYKVKGKDLTEIHVEPIVYVGVNMLPAVKKGLENALGIGYDGASTKQ